MLPAGMADAYGLGEDTPDLSELTNGLPDPHSKPPLPILLPHAGLDPPAGADRRRSVLPHSLLLPAAEAVDRGHLLEPFLHRIECGMGRAAHARTGPPTRGCTCRVGVGFVDGRTAADRGVQRESDESLVASPSVTQLFLALCVKAVVRFAVDFKGRRAGDSTQS